MNVSQIQVPTRHIIRSNFFKLFSRKLAKIEDEIKYKSITENLMRIETRSWYDLRIYELELLIYLFKSRGLFIQLDVANCPRVQKAYQRCVENLIKLKRHNVAISKLSLEPTKILSEILNQPDKEEVFGKGDVIDRFGDKSINIYWCFLKIPSQYHLKFSQQFDTANQKEDNEEILLKIFDKYCEEISMRYICYLEGEIPPNCHEYFINCIQKKKYCKQFKESIEALFYDFDVDVVDHDLSIGMRFDHPERITNRKMLDNATSKVLQTKGNVLKIASVSAEWLTKKLGAKDQLGRLSEGNEKIIDNMAENITRIEIISNIAMFKIFEASGNHRTEPINLFHYQQMMLNIVKLIKQIKSNPKIKTISIKWYGIRNLQHHMTIISNDNLPELVDDEQKKDQKAIYFRRPGKDTEITPVYLTDDKDIKVLTDYFDKRIEYVTNNKMNHDQGGLLFSINKIDDILILDLNPKESPLVRKTEYKHLRKIFYNYLNSIKGVKIISKIENKNRNS
jgi:hypothetical protein